MQDVSPDRTSEIALETVKARAVRGILALTGRTLVLRLIAFIAQGFLWAFLEPQDFGVFLVVSATINFLSYFADIGLGAALIQKKEKPSQEDFRTVFTVQEILVLAIVIIVFLISPILSKTHSLGNDGVKLLWALNISFFLASLKNIPSIILERGLHFSKFIIPQILEDLVYNVSVVAFAAKGFGISSFTYSVLLRGVVGVVAIYVVAPWRPGFAFSRKTLAGLLRFGIPYQLNNFLATLKDDGLTVVLGSILGPTSLGILGTAQKASQYPLRFFMDNVTKVTFPAFSRMQDDKKELQRSLTRSIFFICSLVFPSVVGLFITFPVLIRVIPRYLKWEPSYIPLFFFSLNAIIAGFTTQLTNLLNSVGKIKTTFKLMVMWTVLSWLFIPFLALRLGVSGAALGYALVGISSFVAFYIVKKFLNFAVYESIGKPLIAAVVMGIVLLFFLGILEFAQLISFVVLVVLGGLTYVGVLYILVGPSLLADAKKTFSSIFAK